MITLVLSISALAFVPGPASAAVDQPFGECTEITDMVSTGDGGVLVTGPTGRCLPSPDKAFVAQLNSSGQLDVGFGEGGVVTLPKAWSPTVLRRADGSVLVSSDDRVVALRADGTSDTSFGDSGSIPFGLDHLDESVSGKLVGVDDKNTIRVLDADGAPDPAFNGGQPMAFRGTEIEGTEVREVGPPGFGSAGQVRVPLSGEYEQAGTIKGVVGVLGLEPNGSVDATFGTNGFATWVSAQYESFSLLESETSPDGSTRLFGNSRYDFMYSTAAQFRLSVTDSGQTELTRLAFPDEESTSTTATGFDSSPEGSVLVGISQVECRGCEERPATTGKLAAGMFGPDGQVQPDFNGGWPAYQAIGSTSETGPVLLGEDGTSTVAGSSRTIVCGSGDDFWRCKSVGSMVRFEPDGKPDPSFGDEGVVTLPACPVALCASRYHAPAPKVSAHVRNGVLGITVDSRRHTPETGDWFQLRLRFEGGVRFRSKRVGSIRVLPTGVAGYRLKPGATRSDGRVAVIKRVYKQTGNRIRILIPVKALRSESRTGRRKVRLRVGMVSSTKVDPKTKWAGTSIPRSEIRPGGPRRGRAGTGR